MKDRESSHSTNGAAWWRTQRVLSLATVCLLLGLAGAVLGYNRSSGSGTVRSATTPPSSYQSGLIEKPNPVDNSGNLLITGNVAGGKYFHGNVPYRSTTSIDASLGSTRLDSFMRYTEPTDFGRSLPGTSAFYSPTGTATTLQGGGIRTQNVASGIGSIGPVPNASGVPTLETQTSTGAEPDVEPLGFSLGARLRSRTGGFETDPYQPVASESSLERDRASASANDEPSAYTQQLQALQQRLGQIQAGADELQRSLTGADASLEDDGASVSASDEPAADSLSRRQALLQETARLLSTTMELPPDVMEGAAEETSALQQRAPGLRLYDQQRDSQLTLSAALAASKDHFESSLEGDGQPAAPSTIGRRDGFQTRPYRPQGTSALARDESRAPLQTPGVTGTDRVDALMERLRATSGSDHATDTVAEPRPGRTSAPSVSPPSTSDPARQAGSGPAASALRDCESHLQTGQVYLGQGKYFRAAEAFTLASGCNPEEARAYLGRFQALFGAAEFLGSALSLAKAIELDPKRALQRTDLVWISGGPEAFITRFNDLTQVAQAGDAPQLQFLLAYIYYQMERPEEARVAIDTARKGLPSSVAAEILSSATHQ